MQVEGILLYFNKKHYIFIIFFSLISSTQIDLLVDTEYIFHSILMEFLISVGWINLYQDIQMEKEIVRLL